jgi:hypothetical protein
MAVGQVGFKDQKKVNLQHLALDILRAVPSANPSLQSN